jgi:hypothetical protein
MHSCQKYSYKRLKSAQLLGQLGVFLTFAVSLASIAFCARAAFRANALAFSGSAESSSFQGEQGA